MNKRADSPRNRPTKCKVKDEEAIVEEKPVEPRYKVVLYYPDSSTSVYHTTDYKLWSDDRTLRFTSSGGLPIVTNATFKIIDQLMQKEFD